MYIRRLTILGFIIAVIGGTNASAQNWYKGNLHTHSLWSDGNNYPEMIAEHYKQSGYNFLALTEHNLFQNTEKWVAISPGASKKREFFDQYLAKYGQDWLEAKRFGNDSIRVRLKKLDEYRSRLEESGKFLLINSEEITSSHNKLPVHVNGINMEKVIPKQEGSSNTDVLQHVSDAMVQQEQQAGKNMLFIIDHPSFEHTLTADDIMNVKNARFMEFFNVGSHNVYGDSTHDSVELMWDKVNIHHIATGQALMYGVATDDMHNLQNQACRGWVVVNAPKLDAETLVASMKAGNFYSSTGVVLSDVTAKKGKLTVTVQKEEGVTYKIQFVGTKKGATLPVVLVEKEGDSASYSLGKDDLYVRARIISSKLHFNPHRKGDTEGAWTQPLKN
jgi:hypothetical protein